MFSFGHQGGGCSLTTVCFFFSWQVGLFSPVFVIGGLMGRNFGEIARWADKYVDAVNINFQVMPPSPSTVYALEEGKPYVNINYGITRVITLSHG